MISIIIPTYNNAELLERCLSSISRQAVSEWEAIIIDDGSTDSTAVLCKKYCEKDDRFRYDYQSNSGVSAARNKGLDLCRGDYVTFLDADDYFTEDALSIIENNITKYPGKKLFIYDALIKDSEDNAYIYICRNKKDYFAIGDLFFDTVQTAECSYNQWLSGILAKVYSRDVIEKLRFHPDIMVGEDTCFLIECYSLLQDIALIQLLEEHWYVYDRTNAQSATHCFKRDLLETSKLQLDFILDKARFLKTYDHKRKATTLCKFCWNLFWIMYYQGQTVKENSSCFQWYVYTQQYINAKDLYPIEFDDRLAAMSFKYRHLLKNSLIRKILQKIYIIRKH